MRFCRSRHLTGSPGRARSCACIGRNDVGHDGHHPICDGAWAEHAVRWHLGPLYRAALLLAGSPADAEDLVADTFTTALATHPRQWPSYARPWLYRILIGAFTAAHGPMSAGPPAHPGPPAAIGPAGPRALERLPDCDVIAALRALPMQCRMAVYLADAEEFAYQEIADTTGIPAGAVAWQLHRGRRLLREQLAVSAARRGTTPPRRAASRWPGPPPSLPGRPGPSAPGGMPGM
jgi:RNA polymerase sigma-70 factor, ECF subfamily